MPLYEYQCAAGHVTEAVRPISECRAAIRCNFCSLPAERAILTPPRVFGDYEGYESPASGKWIEGRRQRAEDLARTHCRPYELGEREEMQRRIAANERALDRAVDNAVVESIQELTS